MAKFTDEQIKEALECCTCHPAKCVDTCPRYGDGEESWCECRWMLMMETLDLIKRQEAEKEALIAGQETLQKHLAEKEVEIEKLKESLDKTIYKLEYLLCYATGGKLSKHTYELKTMYGSVNDYIQKCCEEAKSEAIKECTKKLKSIFGEWIFSYKTEDLFKEMVGESK